MKSSKSIKPLVSIISGYYNREEHVIDSINSLTNQSYSNIEIIVFDDCSTDNTYTKLIETKQNDHRIKIIKHEKNMGFVQGLINAIDVSTGEFIAIHGSGDISLPDRIEKQVDILVNNDSIGVVGCFRKVQNKRDNLDGEKIGLEFSGDAKHQIIKSNLFSHGEVMFRRSDYQQSGGYRKEFKFAQDRDLWCRMSRVCHFHVVPEVLYIRKFISDGVGMVPDKLMIQRYFSEFAIQCHQEVLKGNPDPLTEYGVPALMMLKPSRRLSKSFVFYAIRFLRMNDLSSARRFSNLAIQQHFNLKSLFLFIYLKYLYFPYSSKIIRAITATKRTFSRS